MKTLISFSLVFALSMVVIGLSGGCATTSSGGTERVEVDTNAIPNVVIPPLAFSNNIIKLTVGLSDFLNEAQAPREILGIAQDRLAELIGWSDRCKLFEGSNSLGVAYRLDATIRRYSIAHYQSVSSSKTPTWMNKALGRMVTFNGEPVDLGKASWDDTNATVCVDCEFSLRFKRAQDNETIQVATGGFSRITTLKSLAIDLAGFEVRRGMQPLSQDDQNKPTSSLVQGRIIQLALGSAFLKLLPRMDAELRRQGKETLTTGK